MIDKYRKFIDLIGNYLQLPDAFLHTMAGLVIFVLAALVSKKNFGSMVPLSMVFCAEIFNELLDYLSYQELRVADTIGDIVNTIFWPVLIFLFIRFRRDWR